MLRKAYSRYVYTTLAKITDKSFDQFLNGIDIDVWQVCIDGVYNPVRIEFSAKYDEDANEFVSLLKAHFEN